MRRRGKGLGGPKGPGARAVYRRSQNYTHVDSVTNVGKYRVPGRLVGTAEAPKAIGELKDVKYQHWSRQLEDYAQIAESQKPPVPFYLFVRRTTKLSRTVLEQEARGRVRVVRK